MLFFYRLITHSPFFFFFFFNDTATTEIYTLSLHDALPISSAKSPSGSPMAAPRTRAAFSASISAENFPRNSRDRKSTRLNSSHGYISYAVFCLKKKKKKTNTPDNQKIYSTKHDVIHNNIST